MPQVSGGANWLTNVRKPLPASRNPLLTCDISTARLQNERLDRVVEQRLDALHAARHRQLADRTHALRETEKDVQNYRRLQSIIQLNSVAAAIEAGKGVRPGTQNGEEGFGGGGMANSVPYSGANSVPNSGFITQTAVLPRHGPQYRADNDGYPDRQGASRGRPVTRQGLDLLTEPHETDIHSTTTKHHHGSGYEDAHSRSRKGPNGPFLPQNGPINGLITQRRPMSRQDPEHSATRVSYKPHVNEEGRVRYRAEPDDGPWAVRSKTPRHQARNKTPSKHNAHLMDSDPDPKIREIQDLTNQLAVLEAPSDERRLLRHRKKIGMKLLDNTDPENAVVSTIALNRSQTSYETALTRSQTASVTAQTRSHTPSAYRDQSPDDTIQTPKYQALKTKIGRRKFLLVATGAGFQAASNQRPMTTSGGAHPAAEGTPERPQTQCASTRPLTQQTHRENRFSSPERSQISQNSKSIRPKTAHKSPKDKTTSSFRPKSVVQSDHDAPEIRHTSTSRLRALTALPRHKQRRSRREILATVEHHDNPRETVNLPLEQSKIPGRSFQELRTLTHVDHLNDAEKKLLHERAMELRQEMIRKETDHLDEKLQVFYVKLEKFKKEGVPGVKERQLTVITADVSPELMKDATMLPMQNGDTNVDCETDPTDTGDNVATQNDASETTRTETRRSKKVKGMGKIRFADGMDTQLRSVEFLNPDDEPHENGETVDTVKKCDHMNHIRITQEEARIRSGGRARTISETQSSTEDMSKLGKRQRRPSETHRSRRDSVRKESSSRERRESLRNSGARDVRGRERLTESREKLIESREKLTESREKLTESREKLTRSSESIGKVENRPRNATESFSQKVDD